MADWIAPFPAGADDRALATGDVRALVALGWWGVLIEYSQHITPEDAGVVSGYLSRSGDMVDTWIGQVTDRAALRMASLDMGSAHASIQALAGVTLAAPQPLIRVKPASRILSGLVWAPWSLRRVTSPLIQATGLTYTDARSMGYATYYILA